MSNHDYLPKVAYFCMEFGLHPDFPIYSGGLGVLAGDYLKAAADDGLPIIGVGILWKKGYTSQLINSDGRPYDDTTEYDSSFLKDTGVKVKVLIKGQPVACKVWMVDQFRNAPLYLLDADLPENREPWLTHYLYRGSGDDRIAQEIILGIGGVRALRALGLEVDIYHFNEGHAVFAGIELLRERMKKGQAFSEALEMTRKSIVFTTHTPVPAGNEAHHHAALSYLGAYNGLNYEQMKQIGGDPFNMTVAGLRFSSITNAVAQLHAETARKMWAKVSGAAPITHVTNGVHQGTWQDPAITQAYSANQDLRLPHMENKKRLLAKIREETGHNLNPNTLLIGFARRAATYKRGDLIFRKREEIVPLLDANQVNMVFSGKAHPQDEAGKEIITKVVTLTKEFPGKVIFLENYDMRLGKLLTRGSDIWLNAPRRPMEASGTSGMKAGMNGLLNLSTLDGWWAEGCHHGINGWQFGHGYQGPNQDEYDRVELIRTLIHQALPIYYGQNERWSGMMRSAVRISAEQFSARRMLMDYYKKLYLPLCEENISA